MVGIVSNSAALFAQRNLSVAASTSESSISRLSSGNAIVSAADDVAGLAIGTVLRTTVSTLKTILNSAAQATSLLGIADAGLQNIGEILQRQKSLAVQANTGSLSNNERAFLDQEFQNLVSEINRIVDNTKFNGIALLNGSIAGVANATTATGAVNETYSLNATTDYTGYGQLDNSTQIDGTVGSGSGLSIVNSVSTAATQGVGSVEITAGTISAGTQESVALTLTGHQLSDTTPDTFVVGDLTFTVGATTTTNLSNSASLVVAEDLTAAQLADAIATAVNAHSATVTATHTTGQPTLTLTAVAVGNSTIFNNLNAAHGAAGGLLENGTIVTITDGTAADTLNINGRTFTFVSTDIDPGAISNDTNILVGADNEETLENIVAHLNDVTAGVGGQQYAEVSPFTFSNTATELVVTKNVVGTGNDGAVINLIQGSGGDVVSSDTNVTGGAAKVLNNNANTIFDATLQGALTNLTATYTAGAIGTANAFTANTVTFTVSVGGETYTSEAVELVGGAVTNGVASGTGANGLGLTITGANNVISFYKSGQGAGAGGDVGFTLTLAVANLVSASVADQTAADTLATALQTELTTTGAVTVNQSRELSNVDVTLANDTDFEGVLASDITLRTDAFLTDGTFGEIGAFSIDGNNITTTINGVIYTSDLTDNTLGKTGTAYDTTNKLITTDGLLLFQSATEDDAARLAISLTNLDATTIDLSSDSKKADFVSALNALFQVGTQSSLNFQVGTTASDSIGLSLNSASTTSIYKDDTDSVVTLSVSTSEDAQVASDVLDNAINTVTSLRATVGALQSRFNFAAANVNASIQNTEAARAIFLDVDIAEESTKFATAQVRLQASISVLAQANQIPQNLLKLIG